MKTLPFSTTRPVLMAWLCLLLLGFLTTVAEASHYRGASASYTISASGVLSVDCYSAWRSDAINAPSFGVRTGPTGTGSALGTMGTSSTTNPYASGTELGGANYVIRRDGFTFNLNGQPSGTYYARWFGGNRVAGINNVGEGSWEIELKVIYTAGQASAGPTMIPATIDIIGRGYEYTQNLNSTDPDGTPVAYQLRLAPADPYAPTSQIPGLSVNSAGNVTISAANTTSLALGRWAYKVQVTDGSGGTAQRDVLVLVQDPGTNVPPVLSSIGPKTVSVNTPLSFNVSATDSVTQTVTVRAQPIPGGASFPQVSGVGSAASTFAWTPPAGREGTYFVNFEAYDNAGTVLIDSELVEITVTGENNPPVLNSVGNRTVANGATLTFTISGSDPDAGQAVVYSAFNLPPGATFTPATRTFSWTPTAAQYNNTFTGVTFRVTDNGAPNLNDDETINITVGTGNQAPVVAPVGTQTAFVGQPLTFSVSATDGNAAQTISLQTGSGGLPPGATFPTVSGPASGVMSTFNWTPTIAQAGLNTVRFRAEDNGTPILTDEIIVTINVLTDRPPLAVDDNFPAPLTAPPFIFAVLGNDSDPDNDSLTISSVTNGTYGSVTTNGTTVTYTPAANFHGNDTFTYTITSGPGALTDTATVRIYQAPDVLTLAATSVIPSAAILNAVADPRDLSTDVGFQYSTSPTLIGAVLSGTTNVGSGSGEVPASITITGLVPNTRYYYRALAASSAGASTGTIESFLTPVVVWGGAGSNSQTGTLDATVIPGTTSAPIRYVNASNQGYDIVATTSRVNQDGLGSIVGTPGWWFEGSASNVSGYATVGFRFLDSVTNAAVGVTGVRFRLEDAEYTERFANFSYWDAVGNKITLNFDNSVFTYSGTPVFSSGRTAVENGVAFEGGTQMGKWIDIDLSTRAISGFEFQARRQTSSAGSVIMSGWGGGALPMNLWRQAKFGAAYTDDLVAGDFADPNGDGIFNLFAYAFSIEPLGTTSGGLPAITLSGGYLRVTFSRPQSATDLTYQVEVSGDMIIWLPGSKYSATGDIASNANTTQISRTYIGPNETIVVRDNIPAGSGSRYIRVRVTRP